MPLPDRRRCRGSEKTIVYPEKLTTELAFLLGAYLSEGHTTRSNWSVIITNSVMDVLERAQQAWFDTFGLEARITHQPGRCTGLVVSSKRLVEYMDALGCGSRAANKCVPSVIMDAGRREVLAFLQGAALDAYTTHQYAAKWGICLESHRAIDDLQDLLTKLGVANAQIAKWNSDMQKHYYELYAAGGQGQRLCDLVPFLEPDKHAAAQRYLARTFGPSATDVVPGVSGAELYRLIPPGRPGANGRGTGRQRFRHLCDSRTRHVTRSSVERAADAGARLPEWLRAVLRDEVRFAEVTCVGSES
ncbi:hypothetical protein GCM10009606_19090 [Nocardioides aquiterrae]|uniref:DOD-type homing endonuclease domain-containing protein n=1 Tax=Nocardioides aquiterrae TaxID=203799 RepID=A0ABN1UDE2_9ACTN